jgi:Tfp pilus assembly protein PilN
MIKINLAPPVERRRGIALPSFNLGWLFGILWLLTAAGVAGWWWTLDAEIDRLTRDIAAAEAELTRLKQVIAAGEHLKRTKAELEQRVSVLEGIARLQARPVHFFDTVPNVLTRDLWLTRVEERFDKQKSQKVLTFVGTTYSATALADFMQNLRATGKFKDVEIVESRQDLTKSPRTITFEVSCRFEI